MPAHHAFNRAKTFVAGLVAVQIVEQLEMADVDEQQPERQVRPLCDHSLISNKSKQRRLECPVSLSFLASSFSAASDRQVAQGLDHRH